jgi:plasmid stabilization system protein ParE
LNAAELAEFEAFYCESACNGADQAEQAEERLLAFNRRLARDARSGRFEGREALRFRALLERQVRARLRVGNPKYLASTS